MEEELIVQFSKKQQIRHSAFFMVKLIWNSSMMVKAKSHSLAEMA